jgi:hypothetical protein
VEAHVVVPQVCDSAVGSKAAGAHCR